MPWTSVLTATLSDSGMSPIPSVVDKRGRSDKVSFLYLAGLYRSEIWLFSARLLSEINLIPQDRKVP